MESKTINKRGDTMELRWFEVITGRHIVDGKWEPTYTATLQYRNKATDKWKNVPTVREEK